MPDYLKRVYHAFTVLSGTRDYGANGVPLRIKLSEIRAYIDLYPTSDPHWLIDLLIATDEAFISGLAEKQKPKKDKEVDKPPKSIGKRR